MVLLRRLLQRLRGELPLWYAGCALCGDARNVLCLCCQLCCSLPRACCWWYWQCDRLALRSDVCACCTPMLWPAQLQLLC